MGVLTDTLTLANGVTIPQLGFGTWQTPNDIAPSAVWMALDVGYTHIDTAHAYQNQEGVGQGVRASALKREQIFITTKIPAEYKTNQAARRSLEKSLRDLKVDYVDLLLIHAPRPWSKMSSNDAPRMFEENVDVWQAMEEAYQRGEVRAIGVSNFAIDDIENITDNCTVAPMANQIRFHVGYTEDDLVAYCHAHNIVVEAYSPIGTGKLLGEPAIGAVAEKYDKSVAQVCIRYALQRGCVVLPKSVHDDYIRSNVQVDFEISAGDMAILDAIDLP